MEGAKNDVLSCDGKNVFMRNWAFDLNGKNVPQEMDHLFSITGFLDTSWFRRTYWMYGRKYIGGAQGWASAGNERPSGRILSIDATRIYGYGRDYYPPTPSNGAQMYLKGEQEMFFSIQKPAQTIGSEEPEQGSKGKKRKSGKSGNNLWSIPADLQTRAMVLAGEGNEKRLIIAGAKGEWRTSKEAFEGKLGNVLRYISPEDGKTIKELDLPGLPVFDGMAATNGRLFISLADGSVLCFE